MRSLVIRGEKRKIPPFPHHKDYVLRCNRFFEARNFFSFLFAAGWYQAFREIINNARYGCAIPRDLLIDPTSACNLSCKGCWAADYRKKSELSFEKLDEILTEATRLGTIDVLVSGGEPLLRKHDLVRLCEKHRKLTFGVFTNGTLIDEKFADEMVRLENLNMFISVEGFREHTDFRRGSGTFDKAMRAMDILKERDLGFGFSACYHSRNCEEVSGDAFLDFMREKGAWFGWLFNYLPIGRDADLSLCCSAEQRALVMQRVSTYFKKHKFTLIDLMNSGHKAYGCVGAGNGFAHINANGDMEPCAFCHYSDANIHDMGLLEALRSPFFKRFRAAKPFSGNLLRPCPMMDNPDAIVKVASGAGVCSTHLDCPETPRQLADKTRKLAERWKPLANELIHEIPDKEKRTFTLLTKLVLSGSAKLEEKE
jgi:MoaA/NifB/PqqE/SkfB family radical SAM enzyme